MTKGNQSIITFTQALLALVLVFLCLSNSYGFKEKNPDLSLFNHDKYILEPHVEIFEDKNNQLTIDYILENEDSIGFTKNQRKHINYSFTSSTIWIRLDVDYPVHSSNKLPDRTWYLEVERASLDTCELFIVNDDNSYTKLKEDASVPLKERMINSPTSVFPIPLQLNERKRIYIKLQTIHTLYFHLNLWRPEAFIQHSTQLQLSYGFFYGGMAIVIIYNLFHFFATRDKNYIFYIGYMASITLLEFIELGHGLQLIGPLQDYINKSYIPSIGWFCWANILLFSMTYLETKKNHPFFHFVLQRLIIILIFNLIIDPFMSYQTSLYSLVFFSVLSLTLIPYTGIYSWINGNANAEYFTYAIMCSIVGIIIYCLITMDVLPASNTLISLFSFGILAEALLFSLAIGNRINRAQKDALESNQIALDNRTRYQSLFENAKEGMYQIDLNGTLLQSNKSLANILGFADSQSLISSPSLMNESFFRASGFQPDLETNQENHRSEFSFINENDEEKWVNHSINLVRDENNNPLGYEGIVIDVTDSKEREAAQKASLDESYRKELADKESLETTYFLANMSYRIRASLNSIMGFAEVQNLDQISQDTKSRTARKGLKNSNYLLSLINKILDYSKIEAEKLDIESLECKLAPTIDSAFRTSQSSNNTIKFQYPFPKSALTDPLRLQQCIEEQALFCAENSQQAKVITSIRFNKESSELEISAVYHPVTSLSPEDSLSTFKRKRAWQYTPSRDSGLGLALINNLVALLNGKLIISRPDNKSSSITISLPLKLPDNGEFYQNDKDRLKDIESTSTSASNDNSTFVGKVLVAEDNIVNQKLITKLLEKLGAEVVMANNGKEAVDLAKENELGLILMDLNMPIMDGFAATTAIIEQGNSTPIYALTADNTQEIIERCLSLGFKGHLDKPVKKQKVVEVLSQHLETSKENT